MSFTANITRKHAEAARRRAMHLDGSERARRDGLSATLETERRECVAIWNEFCAAERARLAKRDERNRSFGEILPGVWAPSR